MPYRLLRLFLFLLALAVSGCHAAPTVRLPPSQAVSAVEAYIHTSWSALTRSHSDLPSAARDPKVQHEQGTRWPVYVSTDDLDRVRRELASELTSGQLQAIEIRPLPSNPTSIKEHGLLYLPYPYVVPGGRFNEMYGWDSYFIELGLLRDGRIDRARDLVNNAVYEVQHYGHVLNANRTYYLQRSQPPFLTRMILALFDRTRDVAWLRSTVPAIDRYYAYWTSAPHVVPATGLSRYYALGDGPAPEVVYGERDASGRNHYDRVREYYRTHRVTDYDVRLYYDRAHDQLTPLFYKGDRSVRESGFDPTDRFGKFGVAVIDYAPVCLNTLLYMMEADAADIHRMLSDETGMHRWLVRVDARRNAIQRYLWDGKAGLYYDYNVRTGRRRAYPFATTFYPLWAGLAKPSQADALRRNLSRLEVAGGVLTSTTTSGSQWDAPFGWAPLQMLTVTGLRHYGFREEADRIAANFVSLVVNEFQRSGRIFEKYDVRNVSRPVATAARFGYLSNEIGFGWTNAAVLELLGGIHSDQQR